MSLYRFFELTCDVCNEVLPDHALYRSAREIREAARFAGWKVSATGDFCADCVRGLKTMYGEVR